MPCIAYKTPILQNNNTPLKYIGALQWGLILLVWGRWLSDYSPCIRFIFDRALENIFLQHYTYKVTVMTYENLIDRLSDKTLLATQAYVGGEWIDADDGDTFDVIDPATGAVITSLPHLKRAETARAIAVAETAQKDWAALPAKERSALLKKLYTLMVDNADDLGKILTAEMGKPLAEAVGEINYGASFIEWFAEEGKRVYGDTIPGHMSDKRITVLRQPVGVVAAITPWNFPNAMITRKMAPALAVGCSFVCLPASTTPLSALAIAVLAERAGLPKGVFSIISSPSASDIGKEFCENPSVRKLTFTGSTRVGRILMEQGASQIMKLSLELGGNAPFIVFDDADLDKAIEGAMICKFRNNGQTCVCANRIYVQAGIYDAFAEKFAAKMQDLKVGNGFDTGVNMGPLINESAMAKVQEHIADATTKGGTVVCGGKPHSKGNTFFEPTLITGATQDMVVATDETFGPLAPLFKFETEEEVIAHANNTIYGLAAYFYTNDLSRTHRIQEALEYGIVGVNTGITSTETAPFGGVKQSGLGREGSKYGMDDYLELKYVCTSI